MRVNAFLLSCVFLLPSVPRAFGQAYEGGIRGAVRDQGGVIPGAVVVLTSEATNVARAATTNAVGEYTFVSVQPGLFSVSTEVDGFKPFRQSGLEIGVQSFLVIDIMLELGSIAETITVMGDSPVIDKANASLATAIRSEELENLPTFARNPWFLAATTPGVIQTGAPLFQRSLDQNNNALMSLAGGPVRTNNYTLDGIPISDLRNRAVLIPSVESIEEMRGQSAPTMPRWDAPAVVFSTRCTSEAATRCMEAR